MSSQWLKWNGENTVNDRPKGVDFWDRVEILTRSGERNEGDANCFVWSHHKTSLDIVFFRIVEPANNACAGLAITDAENVRIENEMAEWGNPSRRPASQ